MVIEGASAAIWSEKCSLDRVLVHWLLVREFAKDLRGIECHSVIAKDWRLSLNGVSGLRHWAREVKQTTFPRNAKLFLQCLAYLALLFLW